MYVWYKNMTEEKTPECVAETKGWVLEFNAMVEGGRPVASDILGSENWSAADLAILGFAEIWLLVETEFLGGVFAGLDIDHIRAWVARLYECPWTNDVRPNKQRALAVTYTFYNGTYKSLELPIEKYDVDIPTINN
jgi:glutathione S-transferase